MNRFFAGLDWAVAHPRGVRHRRHRRGASSASRSPTTRRACASCSRDCAARAPCRRSLPIAIERPSGLIVDALVEAGHPVVPIHPNVVKASRPRYRSHGGKSDACDAYLLADLLRTDGHRLRPLRRSPTRSARCARWCAGATTWWPPACSSPTSCAACSRPSGPAPPRSSPTSTRRSRWPSCSAIPRPPAPPAAARSAWLPSSPSTATAAGAAPPSCSRACARARRPRR